MSRGRSIHGRRKWNHETGSYEKPARERAIFPLDMAEYADAGLGFYGGYRTGMTKDRAFAPFQPGEHIYVFKGEIKIARVVSVKAESMKDKDGDPDYYLAKYAVQYLTKDGHWSNAWEYVWPGYIYRAYYITTDENTGKKGRHYQRGLPPFMLQAWLPELMNKLTAWETSLFLQVRRTTDDQ